MPMAESGDFGRRIALSKVGYWRGAGMKYAEFEIWRPLTHNRSSAMQFRGPWMASTPLHNHKLEGPVHAPTGNPFTDFAGLPEGAYSCGVGREADAATDQLDYAAGQSSVRCRGAVAQALKLDGL